MCNQLLSYRDFKILASSNSEIHIKIDESLLILRDQPFYGKMKQLYHYICLTSYTNNLVLYDYLVIIIIYTWLLLFLFNNKIIKYMFQ